MTSGRIMLRGHLSPVDFLQGFFKTLLRRNFTVGKLLHMRISLLSLSLSLSHRIYITLDDEKKRKLWLTIFFVNLSIVGRVRSSHAKILPNLFNSVLLSRLFSILIERYIYMYMLFLSFIFRHLFSQHPSDITKIMGRRIIRWLPG